MAGNPETQGSGSFEKPCRACTDFKLWAKLRNKGKENVAGNQQIESSSIDTPRELSGNCPLNRDDLGRKTWGFLHTMAAYYPDNPTDQQRTDVHEFFKLFSKFYPCKECAEDLQQQIERFPPKTQSQHELSQWLCRVHNRINLRLGKPLFDCSFVNERWRDGWKDGSCDYFPGFKKPGRVNKFSGKNSCHANLTSNTGKSRKSKHLMNDHPPSLPYSVTPTKEKSP